MKFTNLLKSLILGAVMSFSLNATAGQSDIVVFFSATGNTKAAAKMIAKKINAPLLEISAKQFYTDKDLNYRDDDCRANAEMNNPEARPLIANDLSAVNDRQNVYLGYPVWWGSAPRIIQTFIEQYDLRGKNIYLFCTSGGSSADKSLSDLKSFYPEVNFVKAQRIKLGSAYHDINELTAK